MIAVGHKNTEGWNPGFGIRHGGLVYGAIIGMWVPQTKIFLKFYAPFADPKISPNWMGFISSAGSLPIAVIGNQGVKWPVAGHAD